MADRQDDNPLNNPITNIISKNKRPLPIQRTLKALGASIAWTVMASGVGLTQLWITVGIYSLDKQSNYEFSATIRDGSLLFFIMAIITTIAIDYYFDQSTELPRWVDGIIFFIFPFITGIFVTTSYVALHFLESESINYDLVSTIQMIAIVMTIFYALLVKFISFLKQYRRVK